MSKKAAVPSAWDDDWESQADALDSAPPPKKVVEDESKLSKAERLARHAETNKKIWESAQTPENPSGLPFLPPNLSAPVPLATPFKAPLTLLSRKPAPRTITKVDPVTGKTITVEAEEEEEPAAAGPSAEELREKAQRELEEKKKRYDEARTRILGAPSPSPGGSGGGRGGSGGNSPRNGTPTPPYGEERGKGRGRGRGNVDRRSDSRNGTRELFDPNYTPKPGSVTIQKGARNGEGSRSGSGRSTPMQREEEQVIRAPRGPDASGKGFGFANRGGKTS
ncbi:SUZ domain-containing protein [Rutstroemia sp. NJR-2017a WRK4]|nr:SUZ domain-containing protein [Rutstroemia sp. NJR-2017a WRK4]PQE14903.1 SUZ domain-containing protein [Rutstroemia sp. NJR-2017a WRK4]